MAKESALVLLTAQWVKDAFLAGVDLRDDQGVAFPEEMYDSGIRAAIAQTELELGISLDPTDFNAERHDLTQVSRQALFEHSLHHRPIISINKCQMKFGSVQLAILPTAWVMVKKTKFGEVHIVPVSDGNEELVLTAFTSGSGILGILSPWGAFGQSGNMPGWFVWDYTAGFRTFTGTATIAANASSAVVTFAVDENFVDSNYYLEYALVNPNAQDADIVIQSGFPKTVSGMTLRAARAPANNLTVRWWATEIPDALRQLIGVRAALLPLQVAGDMILGAGVRSRSVAMDGLSEGLTREGFVNRLALLQRQEEGYLAAVRGAYRGFDFGSF